MSESLGMSFTAYTAASVYFWWIQIIKIRALTLSTLDAYRAIVSAVTDWRGVLRRYWWSNVSITEVMLSAMRAHLSRVQLIAGYLSRCDYFFTWDSAWESKPSTEITSTATQSRIIIHVLNCYANCCSNRITGTFAGVPWRGASNDCSGVIENVEFQGFRTP